MKEQSRKEAWWPSDPENIKNQLSFQRGASGAFLCQLLLWGKNYHVCNWCNSMRKKSNKFWEHARSKLSPGVSGLKFRYSEKATKIWKNRFDCFDFKKRWDNFFKFCSLLTQGSHNIWTLKNISNCVIKVKTFKVAKIKSYKKVFTTY